MSGPSIYGDRADLYDSVYHWKDYAGEAGRLHDLLRAEGVPDGARLLDVACGTGMHLSFLRRWYRGSGCDSSEPMLAIARRRLPGVPLWSADMTSFGVERPLDVVTCLFSAIGVLLDEPSLERAARCMAGALVPGGVAVVEPWLTPEAYEVGKPTVQTFQSPDLSLARAMVAKARGDVAVMAMHYLVARRGGEVEEFRETHELWLCPRPVLVAAFERSGFDVRFDEPGLMPGRGLLVARRRPG